MRRGKRRRREGDLFATRRKVYLQGLGFKVRGDQRWRRRLEEERGLMTRMYSIRSVYIFGMVMAPLPSGSVV